MTPLMAWLSSLRRSSFGCSAYARAPKTRRCDTSGLLPKNASHGVRLRPAAGARLRKWLAVVAASAHSVFGRPESSSIARTRSSSVRFSRSALPFCSGV